MLLSRTPDGELVAMLADVRRGAGGTAGGRCERHYCSTTGYIDLLLNDRSPVTDGYAVGVTLLQALTGRPVANPKVVCRKLLRLPGRPGEGGVLLTALTRAWCAVGRAARGTLRAVRPRGLLRPLCRRGVLPRPARVKPRRGRGCPICKGHIASWVGQGVQ